MTTVKRLTTESMSKDAEQWQILYTADRSIIVQISVETGIIQ